MWNFAWRCWKLSKERRLGRGLEALLGKIPGSSRVAEVQPETEPYPQQPEQADSKPSAPPYQVGSVSTATDQPTAPHLRGEIQDAPGSVGERQQSETVQTVTSAVGVSPAAQAFGSGEPAGTSVTRRVPVESIDGNPFQPREEFDRAEIEALADSLRKHGLLQPLVVRRHAERYQLVAGERRLRAAALAGWSSVPVRVIEADDRAMAELALVENLQRKDLTPLEKAAAFRRYLELYGATQDELATRLGLDRSTISNFIRLLELPEPVRQAIQSGKITQGHARALLPLGDEHEQVAFCQRIQREGLSVRQTESLVREAIAAADREPLRVVGTNGSALPVTDPRAEHLAALAQEFRIALGTRVEITHSRRGRGKLVIYFHSHEEFERIRGQICDSLLSRQRNQTG